ncbi:MAG: type 1 glutamine amidotransferase domain-containing protein [Porticoccaceae bacterium]|nr:type 1 glutamine amidotransferase domain-containing protein [Porticoccaceae bacterium]MDG1474176.1 type 1 glutamine amidotransferase domain-containing protein [Porticoccaceae bacterium]
MRLSLTKIFGVLLIVSVIFFLALPIILHKAGLHPEYTGQTFILSNDQKALIIGTNHKILSAPGEKTGDPTGAAISEISHPYYTFLDAGMQVDVASILGGEIPVDPQTLSRMMITNHDKRYLDDAALQAKMRSSIPIKDIDFTQYDTIFLAGGWGAAYDLGYSVELGAKISEAYYGQSTIIGGVCHGVLGLIKALDDSGNPLIAGRKMTGVTNKQIKELGITQTPMHPETELKKAGAIFKSATAFQDFLATHVTVDLEQRFVTGQNQNSGLEAAHQIVALLAQQ